MSYTFTYRFDDLPVADAVVDGWAEINFGRDGSWEVGDCEAEHAYDADGNDVTVPGWAAVRCALSSFREADINSAVMTEAADLDPPEVERQQARADEGHEE